MAAGTENDDHGRRTHACRVAVLTDTASYFRAFHEALRNAREQVFIIAWDLDSRVEVLRDGGQVGQEHEARSGTLRSEETRGGPVRLLDFLVTVARERPSLQIRILCWDAAILYAFERELARGLKFRWQAPKNVQFVLESASHAGVSLHQKIVVVDDGIAFSGGGDITRERWDTAEHRVHDPRRRTADGKAYGPFHDVQILVDGDAAHELGETARQRWQAATGETVGPPDAAGDPWPESCPVDLRDVPLNISCTVPEPDGGYATEIRARYLAMIAAAQRTIYIETQYLSAPTIADALAQRLSAADGPEVVIVTSNRISGMKERATIDIVRRQTIASLRERDPHGRLRIVYPAVSDGLHSADVYVHSKVCIVDDRWLHVGSANLTTRSLTLDLECDVSVEGDSDTQRDGIEQIRAKLLGIHLGAAADEVRQRLAASSLGALVDTATLDGNHRLLPMSSEHIHGVGLENYADVDYPLEPARVADDVLGEERASPPIVNVAILLALTIGLAAAWRWTPLREVADPDTIAGWFAPIQDTVWGPAVAVAVFAGLGVLGVPVTIMIIACGVAMGTWLGVMCALLGSALAALGSFAIGRWLGGDAIDRLLWSDRAKSIHERIASRGAVAVAVLRIVPVAPFFVVNLVAGATKIRLRDFIIATVVAMAPGIVAMVYYGSQLADFLEGASIWALLGVAAIVVAVVAAAWAAERLLDAPRGPKEAR